MSTRVTTKSRNNYVAPIAVCASTLTIFSPNTKHEIHKHMAPYLPPNTFDRKNRWTSKQKVKWMGHVTSDTTLSDRKREEVIAYWTTIGKKANWNVFKSMQYLTQDMFCNRDAEHEWLSFYIKKNNLSKFHWTLFYQHDDGILISLE